MGGVARIGKSSFYVCPVLNRQSDFLTCSRDTKIKSRKWLGIAAEPFSAFKKVTIRV